MLLSVVLSVGEEHVWAYYGERDIEGEGVVLSSICISEVVDILPAILIPACDSSILAFRMMDSA